MADSSKSRRRTAKQNIAGDQFDLGGLQQQKRQRTKQFRKEAGSYRGATSAAIQAVKQIDLGGLQGTPEGAQLKAEKKGRAVDLRNSLPFVLAPAQREFKSDIQGINADITGKRFDLAQHQQDLQQAIRDAQQEVAQNKAEKRADVDHASKEALRLVQRQALTNADPKAKAEDKGHPVPQTQQEWMNFEDALRKVEGVTPRSARKAVKRLQQDWGAVQARGIARQVKQTFAGF